MHTLSFVNNELVTLPEIDTTIIYMEKQSSQHLALDDFAKGFPQNKDVYKPYWLQKWAAKTKIEGKSIVELFVQDSFSLWYLFQYPLWAGLHQLPYYGSGTILYWIDIIMKILDQYKPEKVYVQNGEDFFYCIVIDICRKRKIDVKNLSIKTKKSFSQRILENRLLLRMMMNGKSLLRRAVGSLSPQLTDSPEALILSNARFIKGQNEENLFWGTLIKQLEKERIRYAVLEYEDFWSGKDIIRLFNRYRKDSPKNAVYFGSYYDRAVVRQLRSVDEFSRSQWQRMKRSPEFFTSLTYKGINIAQYVLPRFDFVFTILSFVMGEIVALSASVLEKTSPELVLLDHEMNYNGLGFLLHSRTRKLKSIALQFENVSARSSVHLYWKNLEIRRKKSVLWRPLPDIKCVSGNFAKKVLLDGANMTPEQLVVTGQSRYDALVKKTFSKSKKQVLADLGLDAKKKTILYATKFRSNERATWKELQRLVKERDDIQVIFKLAPVNKVSDYKDDIIPGQGIVLTQEYDIFSILGMADLLISVRSTTVMEAMCLKKPVLLVDYYKTAVFPYVQLGAVHPLNEVSELDEGISACLYDRKMRRSLTQGQKKFLKEYLYKQDGKAAERVMAVVKRLLKN
jgi:hypothetical protein